MAATLPRNDELADQLELLADLSELEGEDSFRVLAYRRAATRIRETGGPVAQLALEGKAKELSGIGKTIEEKIVEVVETGEMAALTKRKALVPEEVVKFMRLPGLGPKTARRIWKELGVTTIAELKEAAEQQRLRVLTGLGAKSEEKILAALAEEPKDPRESRRLLGDGLPVLLELVEELRQHPAAVKVSEAGSARRRRETFRDLDVIATSTDPAALIEHFTARGNVASVVAKGDTKATVITNDGLRLDLRVVPPESYGNLLQHFTGSKEHNVALREDAVRRGFSVSEYSVTNTETGEEFRPRTRRSCTPTSATPTSRPSCARTAASWRAARSGELPVLVERGDLRGDLHSHSTWSDGKATVEEMARSAQALGHEYLAMCDHSPRLRDGRLQQQWQEIDALNEALAPFRILKGIEVNIRANGELDVSDDILEQLDWVMASVHTSFDKDPTERVLHAMESPHVDCIGHLTSRRIGVRNPSTIEVEKVVEAALATGTFLEINSQPDRLDLRDANARLAGEAGRDARDLERRALDEGAPLRRSRRRAGAARLADEGSDPEHAPVESDREAPEMSFREDGVAAVDWVASYFERLRDFPVLAQVEPGELRSRLPASPPETAEPFANVLRDLDEILMPAVTHWQSPRFFAYFANTGSEPGVLAELLSAGLNQVGILWRTSPALQELEEVTLDWLAQLLGLPDGLHGHIEDTASTCTMVALAAARQAKPGARVVVTSEHAHSSVAKACRLLELEVRLAPVDDAFRIRADALDLEDACAVVATIGTTSTSSVDPVDAIADRAEAAGVWLHVDAAYAGSAAVCPELRAHFAGWERADSIVVNPHKWLLTPMDCSTMWTRRPDDLRAAFSLVPEFLRVSEEVVSLSEYSPVLGRRFRALKLWAVLRCYGREGLQERIREAIRLAALFEGWVRDEPGWEVDCAAAVLARLLPPRRLRRGERGAAPARQCNRRDLHLAHEAERPLLAATRGRQRAHDRGGRAARLGRAQAGSGLAGA